MKMKGNKDIRNYMIKNGNNRIDFIENNKKNDKKDEYMSRVID